MDNSTLTVIALGGLLLSLGSISGLVLYILTRARHDEKTAVRVFALEKSLAEQIVESSLMLARGKAAKPWVQEIEVLDDKLSEHIVALTHKLSSQRAHIVVLTEGLNTQRSGLEVTSDALVTHVKTLRQLEELVYKMQDIERRNAADYNERLSTAESQLKEYIPWIKELHRHDQRSYSDHVRLDVLERALRGAEDFREFVESMYSSPDGT